MSRFDIMIAACPLNGTEEGIRKLSKSYSIIVTKTCTLRPIKQNSKNGRWHVTGSGGVNRIGLVNPGYDYYAKIKIPQMYIISVIGDFTELVSILHQPTTADGFEVNMSCPNIKYNFKDLNTAILHIASLKWTKPYGLKLPPLLTVSEIEKIAETINFTSLSSTVLTPPSYVVCCNTFPNGIIDGKEGAVSGPALKPISLFNVRILRKWLISSIKVYGCGGIEKRKDMLDYQKEGANGVQICTGMLPRTTIGYSRL